MTFHRLGELLLLLFGSCATVLSLRSRHLNVLAMRGNCAWNTIPTLRFVLLGTSPVAPVVPATSAPGPHVRVSFFAARTSTSELACLASGQAYPDAALGVGKASQASQAVTSQEARRLLAPPVPESCRALYGCDCSSSCSCCDSTYQASSERSRAMPAQRSEMTLSSPACSRCARVVRSALSAALGRPHHHP